MEKETSEKSTERYIVGRVATETEPIIVDTKTEEQFEQFDVLARIMNTLEKLNKKLD